MQTDTFERLCLGQLHETIGPAEGEDPIEHYLQVLADKTGSLIATAAEVGVLFSNADESFIEPLRTFGEKVGVAFQLIDDIIDLSSEIEATGKQAGTDLRSGVSTLPLLYLRRAALTDSDAGDLLTRLERELQAEFYGEGDEAELAAAIAELREHPVTEQTLERGPPLGARRRGCARPAARGAGQEGAHPLRADTIVERSN